jgi:hypothetical protein
MAKGVLWSFDAAACRAMHESMTFDIFKYLSE